MRPCLSRYVGQTQVPACGTDGGNPMQLSVVKRAPAGAHGFPTRLQGGAIPSQRQCWTCLATRCVCHIDQHQSVFEIFLFSAYPSP
jgi:hypothetical protein